MALFWQRKMQRKRHFGGAASRSVDNTRDFLERMEFTRNFREIFVK
jgi:hypothetical protein